MFKIEVDSLYTVDAVHAHNPVLVALHTVGSLSNAKFLWLANDIRDPFAELTEGRELAVPSAAGLANISSQSPKKTDVGQAGPATVKVKGNKLIY